MWSEFPIFPPPMRRIICLLLVFIARLANAGDWAVHQVGGRDYLDMDNIADFYGLKEVKRTEKEVTVSSGVRSLRATMNSAEFYINNLKFILSYPAVEHGGKICISRMDLVKLIEPVMRPSKIKNAQPIDTVVLDAGHGGHDNGAMSQWGGEKTFALDTVQRARALLQAAGYKVVLTRSDDTFIPLDDRVRIANKYRRAIFVSVHFNAGGYGTGVETYTLAPSGVPSMMADGPSISDFVECAGHAHDAENIALATATHAALVVKTRMFDRGLKRARFVVIRDLTIPGVLIEGGFQSNPYDAKFIATPIYRQTLAQAIFSAVENYKRAVGNQPKEERVAAPEPPKIAPPKPAPIEPPSSQ
jgi:N-acetylmuramoyl-L-alanine amidase